MKILITGGCGFLGSNLAREGVLRGIEIFVVDNLSRLGADHNLSWLKKTGHFGFGKIDIRDALAIHNAVATFRPDAVFHLAGQVAMTTSITDPVHDFSVNAMGTLNVLEAIRKHAPHAALIYSSTNKVYGDLETLKYWETPSRYQAVDYPNGFDEHLALEFSSPYGCSKGAADQYVLDYTRTFGLKTVVFRHSSMYGARQFATYDQGWIGWFCQKAIEASTGRLHKPFTISGTGKQVRDVLHVEDMVRLYFLAIAKIEGARGRAFNIGGGMENSLSLLELFDLLEGICKTKLPFERLPPRASDQKVFIADIASAHATFGWRPKISAAEGIEQMIRWTQSMIEDGAIA